MRTHEKPNFEVRTVYCASKHQNRRFTNPLSEEEGIKMPKFDAMTITLSTGTSTHPGKIAASFEGNNQVSVLANQAKC